MNKIILLLTAGVFFTCLTCCEKKNEKNQNVNVDNYIKLLKSNSYDSFNLPALSYLDIPYLLNYRTDKQMITIFPHNPISSLYNPECKLGIYVLWTIESIRLVSIKSDKLIMRFPSQNPILCMRDSANFTIASDEEALEIAANAYYNWWKLNSNKEYDSFKFIDPLEGTKYKWH